MNKLWIYLCTRCFCLFLLSRIPKAHELVSTISSENSADELEPIPEFSQPPSGQVLRLRGGLHPWEGEIQVNVDGTWNTLCNRNWLQTNDDIICQQLGFSRGASINSNADIEMSHLDVLGTDVQCFGNETSILDCPMTIESSCSPPHHAAKINCMKNRASLCEVTEVLFNNSCYQFVMEEADHKTASALCRLSGGRLLAIESQDENNFISEWLINTQAHNVWRIGGWSFRNFWRWDVNWINFEKFTKWFPGDSNQNSSFSQCLQLKRFDNESHLLDYYFWFAGSCEDKLPFICKKDMKDVGCIHGNGANYKGTANVSQSGEKCIRWDEPSLQRLFKETTFNSTMQSHNYCRNINEDKSPWCYISNGKFDYCDIPPCETETKISKETKAASLFSRCRENQFECSPTLCIHRRWVCDGESDCMDGRDELNCTDYIDNFIKYDNYRYEDVTANIWKDLSLSDCSRMCFEFSRWECLSFSYREHPSTCILSPLRPLGTTSVLKDLDFSYYERPRPQVDCGSSFSCRNGICVNSDLQCDGKDDCFDRSDETNCDQSVNFSVRLVGGQAPNEGRLEVHVRDQWGIICDDYWDMMDASVACKELGFPLGALRVLPAAYFGSGNGVYLMDDVQCLGNETSLSECTFGGWGNHNCKEKEAAGVICKTKTQECSDQYFRCLNGKCILLAFLCDQENDCGDMSDENSTVCQAPLEVRLSGGATNSSGRVEIKYLGVWGTICDDEWDNDDAKVVCRMLGFHGPSISQNGDMFGPGSGPIWVDDVQCFGEERSLDECDKSDWLKHNCYHKEDAGVICSEGVETTSEFPDISELLPLQCGTRIIEDKRISMDRVRIIGGMVARYGSHPWQAGIRLSTGKSSSHWCGGSIISEYFIITAAHCLEDFKSLYYVVRVGEHDIYKEDTAEEEFRIEKIYKHEDYDKGRKFNNDIALLKLRPNKGHGIQFNDYVQPICLPSVDDLYTPGLKCIISGWGTTGKGYSQRLQAAEVSILSQAKCTRPESYGKHRLTTGMFCAGDLLGGVDSCQGDSGGPLVCNTNGRNVLMGVISWGSGCARQDKPGVYVRVQKYIGWIHKKLKA